MKKNILLYSLSLLLLSFASCQREADNEGTYVNKGFSLKVTVDEIEAGGKTRASIPSADGEKTVNSLYLVFFEYKSDKSGEYKGYFEVPAPSDMDSDILVTDFTQGTYDPTADYSILAFANMGNFGISNGYVDDISQFLEDFKNKTEKFVLNGFLGAVTGAGTNEDDDSHTISPANLLMSASTTKMSGDTSAVINLKRGVSRFDVENQSDRVLKSVSIWGAASTGTIWEGKTIASDHLQRFYGIKNINATTVNGGLYAFENAVVEPSQGDKITTCLIVGLEKDNKITYYRANIHPADENQNLKRNYCYKITILSVSGDGTDTEYEAWTQAKNQLFVSVNAWNKDDNGMMQTDGTNVLGIQVKRIRLDSRGDIREYSIHTVGEGTLEITKSELDGGLKAEIVGNVLRVTGEAMRNPEDTRRGNIEISFAGLRLSVDIIQEKSNDKLLSLDRVVIANFGPLGRYSAAGGPLTVTASGLWTAEIINTHDDVDNPGFSFNPSGAPVIKLESLKNPFVDKFQIYTTGDNPYDNGEERSGILIVSLDEDPENYSIAIPLTQDKKPTFNIKPVVSEIRFNANGTPSDPAITGRTYEFEVNSSEEWEASLEGADAAQFTLTKPIARRFVIKANGANAGTQLSATIKVANKLPDSDPSYKEQLIRVIQEGGSIKVTVTGQVPTDGGEVAIMVEAPEGLAWTASLEEQWYSEHKAYINTKGSEAPATGLGPGSFRVGYNPLFYPFANVTPVVKVKIQLDAYTSTSQIVEVMQLPFKPTSLKVMDVRSEGYGALKGSYFDGYKKFIDTPSLFGPSGRVKLPTVSITEVPPGNSPNPGGADSEFRYLHAGGRPDLYLSNSINRFNIIEEWRLQNDGVIVFVCDERSSVPFQSGTTLGKIGYAQDVAVSNPRIRVDLLTSANSVQKNIMRYLLEDGPFGVVNNPASLSFSCDGTSNTVIGYSGNAVPVIANGNNPEKAALVIDPDNRLVYLGEGQMFHGGYNTSISSDKDRFLANLQAYILNAALQGSLFTDAFQSDEAYKKMLSK